MSSHTRAPCANTAFTGRASPRPNSVRLVSADVGCTCHLGEDADLVADQAVEAFRRSRARIDPDGSPALLQLGLGQDGGDLAVQLRDDGFWHGRRSEQPIPGV